MVESPMDRKRPREDEDFKDTPTKEASDQVKKDRLARLKMMREKRKKEDETNTYLVEKSKNEESQRKLRMMIAEKEKKQAALVSGPPLPNNDEKRELVDRLEREKKRKVEENKRHAELKKIRMQQEKKAKITSEKPLPAPRYNFQPKNTSVPPMMPSTFSAAAPKKTSLSLSKGSTVKLHPTEESAIPEVQTATSFTSRKKGFTFGFAKSGNKMSKKVLDEKIVKKKEEAAKTALEAAKRVSAKLETDVDPLDSFMTDVEATVQKIKTEKKGTKVILDDDEPFGAEENFPDEFKAVKKEIDLSVQLMSLGKVKNIPSVDHSKMQYAAYQRDFYIECQEIENMSKAEVTSLRKILGNIKVKGKPCPKPVRLFSQCGLSKKVLDVIKKLRFTMPTPIQAQAIPAVMSGRDMIGVAKTGSGKTLAFVLPMLRHINAQRPIEDGDGPIAMIMAPTRELAAQIFNDTKKFCKAAGFRVACAYGGVSVSEQIAELKRGAEVVVCTPGRMIDLLCANSGRVTNVQRITYLVIDEADRMFDLGFEPQIMRIINNIRPDRQTVLFSATFPRTVEALARRILVKPLEIVVGERSVVCDDVTQILHFCEAEDGKYMHLLKHLSDWHSTGSCLVFVERHESCDMLKERLALAGYKSCKVIHGGMEQGDRDQALVDFKNGTFNILIATSVCARGLHVDNLKLVVNYNAPSHYEDYVHRVGRTGRAGNKGTAVTILTAEDAALAADLEMALERSGTTCPEEIKDLAKQFSIQQRLGVVHRFNGFSGKGFKFDKEEANAKMRERNATMVAAGLAMEDEEPAAVEEEEDSGKKKYRFGGIDDADCVVMTVTEKEIRERDRLQKAIEQRMKKEERLKESLMSPQQRAVAAAQRAAKQLTQQMAEEEIDGNSNMTEAKKMSAKAAGKLGLDASGLNAAAMAAQNSTSDDFVSHYIVEIDINDYPLQARFKVTQKEACDDIAELFRVGVSVRGSYFPPNKKPQPGEKRIHLCIEGPEKMMIEHARDEVKRQLEDAAIKALSCPSERGQGRFTV